MKTIKSFVLALCCACIVAPVFANGIGDNPKPSVNEKLKLEIVKMLKHPNLKIKPSDSRKAMIYFVINSKNELKVVEVSTRNDRLKEYIEARLDDRVLKTKNLQIKKTYSMPITFKIK